jgi:hypothetical protein
MKHTNLFDEIEMNEPTTHWHSTLVAVVAMIAFGFIILMVATVISDVMPVVQ